MKERAKKVLEYLGIKGMVRNHSSTSLWVVETTTNDPKGPALAHVLNPRMKSPKGIDADGYKRRDGHSISGHSSWWKISDVSTADIFDDGNDLSSIVLYKSSVSENEFGPVTYVEGSWGVPIQYIVRVRKDRKGIIIAFFVEGKGWVEKSAAIGLVEQGEIDNAVIVRPKNGSAFLRAFPKQRNFGDMEA